MLRAGDVVIARVQFTDTFEIKKRPALVLFEQFGNVVVAGITSNTNMKGILITKKEGAIKDSIIKLNYLFTLSEGLIYKRLFHLNERKKKAVFDGLLELLSELKA